MTFTCHICHDPAYDHMLDVVYLPLGDEASAKRHYLYVHNLYFSPQCVGLYPTLTARKKADAAGY